MRKHNEPSLEAERDALREEVARLNQEIRRRQMELDILKKAEEIIKKDPGISISHLNNREKTKIADALRQTYTSVMAIVACMRCSGMRGGGYQKRLYADLWWRNSLSSAVTVVVATAHIAEKSDRLRITLSPEILRRSNLIRNG